MKRKTTASVMALVIAASVLFFSATPITMAQDSAPTEQLNQIIQNIASKLNMRPDDVRAVFEEVQKERKDRWLTQFTERLNTAVTENKITESQKQLILAKQQELVQKHQSLRDSFQNLTIEEKKNMFTQQESDLAAWANENNLDLDYIMKLGLGHNGAWRRGFKVGLMHENN